MNNELEQYQNVRVQTDRQTDGQTHVSASQLASVGLAQARPNYAHTLPLVQCVCSTYNECKHYEYSQRIQFSSYSKHSVSL